MNSFRTGFAAVVAASVGVVNTSEAAVTYSGVSGSLSASVTFAQSGNNLVVTLTNTSTADVTKSAEVLTAVFFDVAGSLSLTRVSAVVAAGSGVFTVPSGAAGPVGANGNVGGEWSALANLSGAPSNAKYGISSSGLDLFGPGNRFDTTQNLQGPTSPDGIQYGITSAGDNLTTQQGNGLQGENLIKNSVVFTFSGITGTFDFGRISNVSFQYGTSLGSEPNIPGVVPTPGAVALLAGAGLALRRRR